ncbi:MAG: MgtC/SapB family protein [Vicinamibacterales bacterium]
MNLGLDAIAGLVVAILGGAAVGVERQRSGHATGPEARLGGVRTFTLLGTLAGIAGLLTATGYAPAAGLLIAGALALIVAGYVRASKIDVDATTEVAALVVLAAGLLSGLGELRFSAALTTMTVLLLAEKQGLHKFVDRLDNTMLLAAARVAVMSVVILPLLPEGPFGPAPGIRPRDLWILVLLFSSISFVGFIAQRLAGAAGYPLTGLLGGLVSSTSVTLTFARLSRAHPTQAAPLATGAVAASVILFLRVAVAVAVLNTALLPTLAWYLAAPLVAGLAVLALAWRSLDGPKSAPSELRNPLQFRAALEMAALFQVVLFAVYYAQTWLGESGVMAGGFLLGLTDVDALTLAMARSVASGTTVDLACRAILMGVIANSLMKAGIATVVGERRFAWQTGASLLAMAAAGTAMLSL